MSVQEAEVSGFGIKIRSKGLLGIKLAFVGFFSVGYLYYSLFLLGASELMATQVFLLTVIVFVLVFFGSLTLTFSRSRPKQTKKRARTKRLEDWK